MREINEYDEAESACIKHLTETNRQESDNLQLKLF